MSQASGSSRSDPLSDSTSNNLGKVDKKTVSAVVKRPESVLQLENEDVESSFGVLRMIVLTCGIGGLQVIWSVILSQGAPFLVSLGLSKSLTALVWVAGPLCGAFVQPIVGYLSDKSRLSLGQRRPFIIFGAVSTVFSILMLAWTESGTNWFFDVARLEIRHTTISNTIIAFAVFWIYVLNISIQPLQVGLRALVIENCPSDQQARANVWASLMTGAGNIFGYLVGFAPLPSFIEELVQTRFQGLCIIASVALAVTVPVTCCFVHERDPETLLLPTGKKHGLGMIASRLFRTFRTMPLKIRKVLQIQFFAWMAWFPYLFYATTYIGELYHDTIALQSTSYQAPSNTMRRTATRVGTFATFLAAIVALLANIFLHFIVRPNTASSKLPSIQSPRRTWYKFSKSQIWTIAHISFAFLMFSTILAETHIGGTIIIALTGISWAMTLWAPYAIIGQELAAKSNIQPELGSKMSDENQAGVIMSLHNTAISMPQIVAALVCSAIFGVSRAVGSEEGVAWCLRAGGLAALAAAWSSLGLDEE